MTERVTRADLEQKLTDIEHSLTSRAQQEARDRLPMVIGLGLLIVILAYLLGRRRGHKKTTLIEIKRV